MFQINITLLGLTSTAPVVSLQTVKCASPLKLRAVYCHWCYNPAVTELSGLKCTRINARDIRICQHKDALHLSDPCMPISSLFHSVDFSLLPTSLLGLLLLSQGNGCYTDFFFLWVSWLIWQSEHIWTFPEAGHCSHIVPVPQAMLT